MQKMIAVTFFALFASGFLLACDSKNTSARDERTFDSKNMSAKDERAFRIYVTSVRLETQVAECQTKLATWQSDYPGALNGWLTHNDKLIRRGRELFENMVATAALEGPRKPTIAEALADVRSEAIEQVSASKIEHVAAICRAIGQELMKQDR